MDQNSALEEITNFRKYSVINIDKTQVTWIVSTNTQKKPQCDKLKWGKTHLPCLALTTCTM